MTKISILTNTFPPEMGAASYRIFDIAKALQMSNFSVEVYTPIPNYPRTKWIKPYKNLFFYTEKIENITIRRHFIYPSHSDKVFLRLLTMCSFMVSLFLFSFYSLLKKKKHIIFVQTPPPILPFLALLLKKINQSTVVLNISDLWPSAIKDLNLIKNGRLFSMFTKIQDRIYQKANLCTVQSMEIYEQVKKNTKNIFLLRRGVKFDLYRSISIRFKQNSFRLVYFGVAGVAHGLYDICVAIDFQKVGAQLHLFCDGFERNKLEKLQKSKKGIFLYDTLPREELIEKLIDFDFAFITQKNRIYGTVPSKIYEAAAIGLPIIFIGDGEGKDLIEKYKIGYHVYPKDDVGLEKILYHCKNISVEEKTKWSKEIIQVAKNYFDNKKTTENFINYLYKYK